MQRWIDKTPASEKASQSNNMISSLPDMLHSELSSCRCAFQLLFLQLHQMQLVLFKVLHMHAYSLHLHEQSFPRKSTKGQLALQSHLDALEQRMLSKMDRALAKFLEKQLGQQLSSLRCSSSCFMHVLKALLDCCCWHIAFWQCCSAQTYLCSCLLP